MEVQKKNFQWLKIAKTTFTINIKNLRKYKLRSYAYVLRVQPIGARVCSVSLQSDITNYLPGMHNTVMLVIFMDLCKRG